MTTSTIMSGVAVGSDGQSTVTTECCLCGHPDQLHWGFGFTTYAGIRGCNVENCNCEDFYSVVRRAVLDDECDFRHEH